MATRMRIANWNIEWMNRWFTADGDGAPRWRRSKEAGVEDLEDLTTRVAQVIRTIDADVLTIQEGPSRKSEMALFVNDRLDGAYTVLGPAGSGQQKLYALVKTAGEAVDDVWEVTDEHGFSFESLWEVDIDSDLVLDEYGFTRPPLVLGVTAKGGRELRLLNVHTKSKFVRNGASMWNDPLRRQQYVELAVKARRRISAEAMRIREYLNRQLDEDETAAIVVAGDFNDGPGFDYFEQRYLTQNVAGLIAGSPYAPRSMLRHGFIDLVDKEENYTAEFFDFVVGEQRRILLDHIFASPGLFWRAGRRNVAGRVEHKAYDAASRPQAGKSRDRHPSDHRPQWVEFEV